MDIGRLVHGMEDLVRRTVGPAISLEVVSTVESWNVMADESQLENAVLRPILVVGDFFPSSRR